MKVLAIVKMDSRLEALIANFSTRPFPGASDSTWFDQCRLEVRESINLSEGLTTPGWDLLMKVLTDADVSAVRHLRLPLTHRPLKQGFQFMHPTDHDFEELARMLKSGRFLNLETLDVYSSHFDSSGNGMSYMFRDKSIKYLAEALKTRGKLSNLRSLRVPNCDSIHIMGAIGEGDLLQLRSFSVQDRNKNKYYYDGTKQGEVANILKLIFETKRFLHLEHLELAHGALAGDLGFQSLVAAVRSGLLPALRNLQIRGNQFSPWPVVDLGKLAEGSWFSRLRLLGLDDCHISSQHMDSLLEKIERRGDELALEHLELRENPLDKNSIAAVVRLASAGLLRNLHRLDLSHSTEKNFAPTELVNLIRCIEAGHWPKLETLDWSKNPVDDKVASAIVSAYEKNTALTAEILISWESVRDSLKVKADKFRLRNSKDPNLDVNVSPSSWLSRTFHRGKLGPKRTHSDKIPSRFPEAMVPTNLQVRGNSPTRILAVDSSKTLDLVVDVTPTPHDLVAENWWEQNARTSNTQPGRLFVDNFPSSSLWVDNSGSSELQPTFDMGIGPTLYAEAEDFRTGNSTAGNHTTREMVCKSSSVSDCVITPNPVITSNSVLDHAPTSGFSLEDNDSESFFSASYTHLEVPSAPYLSDDHSDVSCLGSFSDHSLREFDGDGSSSYVPPGTSIGLVDLVSVKDTFLEDGERTRQYVESLINHARSDSQETQNLIVKLFSQLGSLKEELSRVLSDSKLEQNLNAIDKLTKFVVEDKMYRVPRYLFLKSLGKSGAWITLRQAFQTGFKMHFLCEARFEDGLIHEILDQEGFEIENYRHWLVRISPWLKWSLLSAVIVGRFAHDVMIPGLRYIVPNFPTEDLATVAQLVSSAASLMENDIVVNPTSYLEREVSSAGTEINLKERLIAEAVVDELIQEKGQTEFAEKIGLRKVWITRSDPPSTWNCKTSVAWVCSECYAKYGSHVTDITPRLG